MCCSHEKSTVKKRSTECCGPVRQTETDSECCCSHDVRDDNNIDVLRHRRECFKDSIKSIERRIEKLTAQNNEEGRVYNA